MISTFILANHVVGLIIDKDIEAGNLEEVHKIILERISEFGVVNIFCEIEKGYDVAFQCLLTELTFKFKNSQNIDKFAIVTDLAWLRSVMSVTDIFAHSEIETFEISERLKAITWVSQYKAQPIV